DELPLLAQELFGLLSCVTALTLLSLEGKLDERGAERLHLFFDRRAHVVGGDDGAEPASRRDRLQPRDPRPHHQDSCWSYRARRVFRTSDLAVPRRLDLEYLVRVMKHRAGAAFDLSPGVLVLLVGEEGGRPGSGLDAHLEAGPGEHLGGVRDNRHAALALLDLPGNRHLHASTTLRTRASPLHPS